jgi:hypothetical protein
MLATTLGPVSTQAALSTALLQSMVLAAARVAAKGAITAGAVSAQVAALTEEVLSMMAFAKLKSGAVAVSVALLGISAAGIVGAQQGHEGRRDRMGADRLAATAHMVLSPDGLESRLRGPIGSGLTFDQIRPAIVANLKEHGSVKITTLAGIEVSVRLYEERELEQAEPLLKQLLALGPIDLRGPADPMMPPATAAHATPAILPDSERRMREMEQKVDKILRALSGPDQPGRSHPPQPK